MYGIARCPKCGRLQVVHFRAQATTCRYCGKNYTLRPKGRPSRLVSGPFHRVREALKEVAQQ